MKLNLIFQWLQYISYLIIFLYLDIHFSFFKIQFHTQTFDLSSVILEKWTLCVFHFVDSFRVFIGCHKEILGKPRMRTLAHYFYFGIDKFSYSGTSLHNACSEKVGKIEKNRGNFAPSTGFLGHHLPGKKGRIEGYRPPRLIRYARRRSFH